MIRLSNACQADIAWWVEFVERWDSRADSLSIAATKCYQFGAGANITLGHSLCPVTAIIDDIAIRDSGPGLFFQFPAVTKAWFVDQLCATLSGMGLPQHLYAGHSFRIGAATTAAMAGVEDAMIQTLGRWQRAAYVQYMAE